MTIASPAQPVDLKVPAPLAVKASPYKRWASVLALIAAGVVAGVVGSRQFAPLSNEGKTTSDEKPVDASGEVVTFDLDKQSAAGIESVVVTPEPLVAHVWRTGRIALHDDQMAHISPPAEGIVRDVRVKLGQAVAAGDILAVIDSRELGQAKLDAHKARIGLAAERELAVRTQATMANADELLKLLAAETPLADIVKRMADKPIGDWRQQLLGAHTRWKQLQAQLASQKASAGAIAASSILKTEADADAAGAAYTALIEELRFQVKNQVRQAELKLKDAETTLDVAKSKLLMLGLSVEAVDTLDPIAERASASHLLVKAPFAGTVLEKHAVRSERVTPQMQMFVIADLSSVWVQADVFEADLPLIRDLKNKPVVFRSSVAGVSERTATVVNTGELIDKASRSLTLTAEAANADRLLKPGMFVEIGFDTGDRMPALLVPAHVVLRHENKPFVFVQVADDRFRRADVTLGRTAGDKVEVITGLKAGDRVVVRGGFVLKSELLKDQMAGE